MVFFHEDKAEVFDELVKITIGLSAKIWARFEVLLCSYPFPLFRSAFVGTRNCRELCRGELPARRGGPRMVDKRVRGL